MSAIRFVDAHMHLWDLAHLPYPWLTPPFSEEGPNGSVEAIAQTYVLDNYFADASEFMVDKVVHIDAGCDANHSIGETRWLQAMAEANGGHGFPNAIVAFAALNDPKVEATLAAHVESPNVRGVRQIANWHPNPAKTYTLDNILLQDDFLEGYMLLQKYGLSFDLQIYPNQMTQAYLIAKANPDTQVILNHMGMPIDKGAADIAQWKQGMALLASLPNVAVKVSGFGFIERAWTVESMRVFVLETIEHFGTERVAFASDFPTDKLFNTYSRALNAYDEITRDFSVTEREALFARNAERLYRI